MKIKLFFLAVLLTFVGVQDSFSKCMSQFNYIRSLKDAELNPGEVFLLNAGGYAFLDEIKFTKDGTVDKNIDNSIVFYLEGEKNSYKLNAIKMYKGEFKVSQFILRVPENIPSSTDLTFSMYEFYNGQKLKIRSYRDKKFSIIPKTSQNSHTATILPPQIKEFEKKMYGCGPSKNLSFSNPILGTYFYSVELERNNTGKITEFFFLAKNGEDIKFGHGMCFGAFRIKKNEDIKVKFKFYNQSGEKFYQSDKIKIDTSLIPGS